jgi:hypothetical protein
MEGHRHGPELLARVEGLLTRHLGPVARVLVKHAARHVQSPHELFESPAASKAKRPDGRSWPRPTA